MSHAIRDSLGDGCLPLGCTASQAAGPVIPWLPNAPSVLLRALPVPQARSVPVLGLLGRPEVQAGRKSERLSLQVTEAGCSELKGFGREGGHPKSQSWPC